MNKHVNKVRKATGRADAITAGRQQDKQQYLIIQLMKMKESIKAGQERRTTQSDVRADCIYSQSTHLQQVVVFAARLQALLQALSSSPLQPDAELVTLLARYHQTCGNTIRAREQLHDVPCFIQSAVIYSTTRTIPSPTTNRIVRLFFRN